MAADQGRAGDDVTALTPEAVGLLRTDPSQTYLDNYDEVWIGSRWDIARMEGGGFAVYRKGNWVLSVGTLGLALAIVADNGGFPNG